MEHQKTALDGVAFNIDQTLLKSGPKSVLVAIFGFQIIDPGLARAAARKIDLLARGNQESLCSETGSGSSSVRSSDDLVLLRERAQSISRQFRFTHAFACTNSRTTDRKQKLSQRLLPIKNGSFSVGETLSHFGFRGHGCTRCPGVTLRSIRPLCGRSDRGSSWLG